MESDVFEKPESFPKFYFPNILLGDAYKELIISLPEDPNLPLEEVAKDERRGPLTFSTFLLLIIIVIVLIKPDLFKNSIGFIGLLLFYKFLRNAVENAEHESSVKKVAEINAIALAKYQDEMKMYEPFLEFKKAIFTHENEEKNTAKELILNNLHKLKNIQIENAITEVKQGVSENIFLPFLKRTFGEKIKRGVVVSDGSDFRFYFPDFVYHDSLKQIYVDIEIDEPYELKTGKPIHCTFDDANRNNFFIGNYWSIIRFSEKQVITEPENCIKTLQSIINSLENYSLAWTAYVTEDPSWDEKTSIQMEKEGYREKYLGINKVARTSLSRNAEIIETQFYPSTFQSNDDLPF